MREIKFRAWDTEKRQMIYDGYCDEYSGPWESGSTHLSISFNGTVSGQIGDDGGKNGLHEHDADLPFDRFILMQYTGLTDKNRKEIYEGDIVKCDRGFNAEVTWRPSPVVILLRVKNHGLFGFDDVGDVEVIGNIYENPTDPL